MKLFVAIVAVMTCGSVCIAQQQVAPATQPAASVNAAAPATAAASVAAPTPAAPVVAPTTAVAPKNGPDANGRYILREGEDVNLQFAQDLSSKTSSEGDPVTLTLADDLKVGDVVVAKAGAKAVGEVTKAEKAGMMGKPGQLNIRLDYIRAGDEKIRLRGTRGKEGKDGTTGTVVLTVLFGPLGLIHHGSNIEIKKGQSMKAFVSDDVALPPT
jgi:hypothetical protein